MQCWYWTRTNCLPCVLHPLLVVDLQRVSAGRTQKVRTDHVLIYTRIYWWWDEMRWRWSVRWMPAVLCRRGQFCCERLPPQRDGGMWEVQLDGSQAEEHAGTPGIPGFNSPLIPHSTHTHAHTHISRISKPASLIKIKWKDSKAVKFSL